MANGQMTSHVTGSASMFFLHDMFWVQWAQRSCRVQSDVVNSVFQLSEAMRTWLRQHLRRHCFLLLTDKQDQMKS